MYHFTITAINRGFSRSNENTEWEISVNTEPDEPSVLSLPSFYANGNCKDNEGYVSVIFSQDFYFPIISNIVFDDMEIHCYVSVVDVAGKKRFTQSIVCCHYYLENCSHLRLERYLKRDILLNDPAELLPGDCLTVCLDLDFIPLSQLDAAFDPLFFDQHLAKGPTNRKPKGSHQQSAKLFYIPLDTDFGRELCRVSEYFRCASHTSMTEGRTRKVRIPNAERRAFRYISLIFRGPKELKFKAIAEIFQLYVVADKYGIQSVIDTCRQLIKGFLSTSNYPKAGEHAKSVQKILELADTYRDGDLKDTMHTYLESKMNFGADRYALGIHLNEKLCTEWNCEFERLDISSYRLSFKNSKILRNDVQFYQ